MSACDANGPAIGTQKPPDRVMLVPCSASSARQWKRLAEQLGRLPLRADRSVGPRQARALARRQPLDLAHEAAAIHDACPDGAPFRLVGHSSTVVASRSSSR